MNVIELEAKLVEAGCSASNYSIGSRGSDVFCLMQIDGIWKVFYTERGSDQNPIFASKDEAAACEFFFKYQTEKIRHVHIVGFFKSKEKAEALDAQLKTHGLPTWQNHIPYGGWDAPRYRIFVVGKDIFKAREILGEVPVRD